MLNTRVILRNCFVADVAAPICARRVERIIVNEILQLRIPLEYLNCKTLRGVPSDVAMHEPSCNNNVISKCHICKRTDYSPPGLSVWKAMTKYPLSGIVAVSLLGGLSRSSVTLVFHVPLPCARMKKS